MKNKVTNLAMRVFSYPKYQQSKRIQKGRLLEAIDVVAY